MNSAIRRLFVAGALLAFSWAGAAVAQENESGLYLGAGIGQFDVGIDGLDGLDETIARFDADDTAWKVFIGYRFNRFIALEAAWVDFGDARDEFSAGGSSGDYTLSLSGFAPYLIGTFPLGASPFELFAKVGYYFYDVEVVSDLDDLGGDLFSSDSSDEDLLWGAGVGLTLLERLHLRLEYENVDVSGTDDAEAFWLSAAWRF